MGGDGTALKALHAVLPMPDKPVFAMRLPDSVGALANRFGFTGLRERLRSARIMAISPLQAKARRVTGDIETIVGINEIVVNRQRLQAAKLRVEIGAAGQFGRIVGDGLLISTPIGSTGYNQSAGGPTLMMNSQLLVVTGLALRRHSEWSTIVVSDQTAIEIEVIDPVYRPVRIESVLQEVTEIASVRIEAKRDKTLSLLLEDQRPNPVFPTAGNHATNVSEPVDRGA